MKNLEASNQDRTVNIEQESCYEPLEANAAQYNANGFLTTSFYQQQQAARNAAFAAAQAAASHNSGTVTSRNKGGVGTVSVRPGGGQAVTPPGGGIPYTPGTGVPSGIDPATGIPYSQEINPATGMPYTQTPGTSVANNYGLPYGATLYSINPATGLPYSQSINPATGVPYGAPAGTTPQSIDPATGVPYYMDNQINPNTGLPYNASPAQVAAYQAQQQYQQPPYQPSPYGGAPAPSYYPQPSGQYNPMDDGSGSSNTYVDPNAQATEDAFSSGDIQGAQDTLGAQCCNNSPADGYSASGKKAGGVSLVPSGTWTAKKDIEFDGNTVGAGDTVTIVAYNAAKKQVKIKEIPGLSLGINLFENTADTNKWNSADATKWENWDDMPSKNQGRMNPHKWHPAGRMVNPPRIATKPKEVSVFGQSIPKF